jgi:hypothetical protein
MLMENTLLTRRSTLYLTLRSAEVRAERIYIPDFVFLIEVFKTCYYNCKVSLVCHGLATGQQLQLSTNVYSPFSKQQHLLQSTTTTTHNNTAGYANLNLTTHYCIATAATGAATSTSTTAAAATDRGGRGVCVFVWFRTLVAWKGRSMR